MVVMITLLNVINMIVLGFLKAFKVKAGFNNVLDKSSYSDKK